MSWVAAAVGIGGALVANNAANKQSAGASQAMGMSEDQYIDTKRNLAPYLAMGNYGLSDLSQYVGLGANGQYNPNAPGIKPMDPFNFQASPAYNFNLSQGQQAIDKASNARGNFYAPQTLQDISKFSQGLASNEFQNAFSNYNTSLNQYRGQQNDTFNKFSSLAGIGQNAAAGLGAAGANAANVQGQAVMQGANAQAAGTVGMYGNLMQGGANAYNNYLQNQILQNQQGSQYNPSFGGGAYGGSIGYAP